MLEGSSIVSNPVYSFSAVVFLTLGKEWYNRDSKLFSAFFCNSISYIDNRPAMTPAELMSLTMFLLFWHSDTVSECSCVS
jgi:hypothetical protein